MSIGRVCFKVLSSSSLFSKWNHLRAIQSSKPSIQQFCSKNPPSDPNKNENKIIITENCSKRLKEILDSDEILRIGVHGGGCVGFEYDISIEKSKRINPDEDLLFENNKICIDKESLEFILGSKIDYEDELIRSGFVIKDNPNADRSCSCGGSFSMKIPDL